MPELLAIGFLSCVLILVIAILWLRFRNRQFEHQERIAALEKGVALIPAASEQPLWSPRIYLLCGLIWTFTGAGLTIALFGVAWTSVQPHPPRSAESMAMQAKQVSETLQIPMNQARDIVNMDEAARLARGEKGSPLTIALFGLIPLGVGLAYLVYYRSFESGPVPNESTQPPASR